MNMYLPAELCPQFYAGKTVFPTLTDSDVYTLNILTSVFNTYIYFTGALRLIQGAISTDPKPVLKKNRQGLDRISARITISSA